MATASPTASPTATITLTPTATATLTPTATFTPTATLTPTVVPTPGVVFERRLSGNQIGQHSVPPLTTVSIAVKATVDSVAPGARLVDYFPKSWGVANAGGGTVGEVDSEISQIVWDAGDLDAGASTSQSYSLVSPGLTSPPSSYVFKGELTYTGGKVAGVPWLVVVADPATIMYLHGARATVGSLTYGTLNPGAPSSAQRTLSASLVPGEVATFVDDKGSSIFVSDPVPAGSAWNLGGSWSFDSYIRASDAGASGQMRARIYRVDASGTAYLQATTEVSAGDVLDQTAPQPAVWSHTVGEFTLYPGERFGVEFQVRVTAAPGGSTASLDFASTAYPSDVVVQVNQGSMPAPTPTATPAPTTTPQPIHGDNGSYSSVSDACAKCHRTHSSSGLELRGSSTEEQTCYTCHDGTGGPNIKSELGKTYRHPVDSTQGKHRFGESNPESLSGGNRHVECEDCHNPHSTERGVHAPGSNVSPGVLRGSWGVEVGNGTAWSAPAFTRAAQATSEYQLCFKCHSSWAYGGSPPASHSGGVAQTDQAKEFNVNNASYHWVEADRVAGNGFTPRTADPRRPMAFAAGTPWSAASPMTCSDCHSSETGSGPRGPHGSSYPYLLRGGWSPSESGLCLQCHDPNTYGPVGAGRSTGFSTSSSSGGANLHSSHSRRGATCQSCHMAVPHGGQYRALLAPRLVADITMPTTDYNAASRLNIDVWANSGNWTEASCGSYPGCH